MTLLPMTHAHGYNPSMEDYGGATFYAYRWHPKPNHWRTEIAIVRNGVERPLIPPPQYSQHSIEDPRFFVYRNKLHVALTIARTRVSGQSVDPCIVGYGILAQSPDGWHLENWREPLHPNNTWSKQSKNLVFWEDDKRLVFTWTTRPAHVVHSLDDGGAITAGWRTESPSCSFGNYRGGTQSFPFKGNRLRFCHAVQNNPKAVQYWGYSLAAMVFQEAPPFRILQVSQQPILTGNELYVPDCPHWKPRICIPYGAVKRGDGWRVSLGINDCQCALVDLTENDLNL